MFYLIRKKKNLLQLVIKKQVFSYKNFLSSPSLHKDRFYTRSVRLQMPRSNLKVLGKPVTRM